MSSLPPDVRRLLEEQGILQPEQQAADPLAEGRRILQEIGMGPKEEEEGLDPFQPVRTFFGGTGGAVPKLLEPIIPQQYEAARAAMAKAHGITDASPLYERVEAAPGLGDVAAEFVPQEIRDSLVGRALGPVGRLVGNIAGDPTTYTPFVLPKLGGGIVSRIPQASEALEAATRGEMARRAFVGPLDEAAQAAARVAQAREARAIPEAVLQHGTPLQRGIYQGAAIAQRAEPIAFGSAAALAYGPQALRGAYEGGKNVIEGIGEQPWQETVAEGADALLQAGLSAMMAKGLISAAEASARWQRHLAETRPADVEAAVNEVGGRVAAAVDEAASPPADPFPLDLDGVLSQDLEPRLVPPDPFANILAPEGPPRLRPSTQQAGDGIPVIEAPIKPPQAPEVQQVAPVVGEPTVNAPPEAGASTQLAVPKKPRRGRKRAAKPPEPSVEPVAGAEPSKVAPSVLKFPQPPETDAQYWARYDDLVQRGDSEGAKAFLQQALDEADFGRPGESFDAKLDRWAAEDEAARKRFKVLPFKPSAEPAVAKPAIPEPEVPLISKAETPEAAVPPQQAERVFAPEDVDSALTAADDLVSKEPTVAAMVRSLYGFGSQGAKGFRRLKAENLDRVLRDPAKRGALDTYLNDWAEDAASKGDELTPSQVRSFIGKVAQTGEVPKFEKIAPDAPVVAPQKLSRAKVGGEAETIAAGTKAREGAAEAPKAGPANHYDYLKEQLGTSGSALQKAGLKSVGDFVGELKPELDRMMIPGKGEETSRAYVEAYRDYVAAREKGLTHAEAVQSASDAQAARSSRRWSSQQAAQNAINQVAKRVEELEKLKGRLGQKVAVAGRRAPTQEDIEDLAREKRDVLEHIRGGIARGDKEELGAALGGWIALMQRRKLYALPRDYKFLNELKTIARELNARGDGPVIRDSMFTNGEQLAEAIARNRGVEVKSLAPEVEKKLAPVAAAEKKKVTPARARKEGLKGPGGFEVMPTRPGVPGQRWKGPGGTQVSFLKTEGNVRIEKFDETNLDAVKRDLSLLREDPDVKVIDVGEVSNKALDDLLTPAAGRLPAFVEDPDAPKGLDRLVRMTPGNDRVAEMAAREAFGVHPSWSTPANRKMDTKLRVDEWIEEAEKGIEPKNLVKLQSQLKAKGLKLDLNEPLVELGRGSYHVVYEIPGTDTVLRVGKSPVFEWKTPEQRALMMPLLAQGELGKHEGMPLNYAVYPKGLVGGKRLGSHPLLAIDEDQLLSAMAARVDPRIAAQEESFSLAREMQAEQEVAAEGALPPGRTLQEFFYDVGQLLFKASHAGMDISHDVLSFPHSKGGMQPWGLRGEQFAYRKVAKLDTQGVGYIDGNGQAWQLAAIDNGMLTPGRGEWQRDPVYSQMHDTWRVALNSKLPESRLSLSETAKQKLHYVEDEREAAEIGDGLVNANFDRVADEDFVAEHSRLGAAPAAALRRVTQQLVDAINDDLTEGEAKLNVVYKGLTSSPYQSGVYLDRIDSDEPARIYSNIVEAVAAGKNYEDALDQALHSVTHEVTHNKSIGHGAEFQTFQEYVNHHLVAGGHFENYKAQLREALPESAYNEIREGLVPKYLEMRKDVTRSGASWREAEGRDAAVEGVPAGAAEGRAPPLADRPGRGAEGLAADQGRREGPGRAVPGGDEVAAGGVRRAAASSQPAGERRAEGQAARPADGGDPLEAIKTRIAEYGMRPATEAGAKKLLHDMIDTMTKLGEPPNHDAIHNKAWMLAGDLTDVMHPDDLAARANSKSYPRHKDEMMGALNMTHFLDLPVKTKARFQIWSELTDGLWPKDKPQRWEDVDREVQEMFGLHTPEQWTQHFRKQNGGPTARDVLLMRQAVNELAARVQRAEQRFYDAGVDPNVSTARLEELHKEVNKANQALVEGGLTLGDRSAAVGRALAIFRKDVRNVDPQLAFEQNLLAALRERTQTRFKDPKEADKAARDLLTEFLRIRNEPNPDWGEFQKAYRAMLASRVWPDKILEWYKGGLLGWPSRVANMTSNWLLRGVRMAEDTVAAGLDAVGSKLTGKERELFVGENTVSLLAMRRAWGEALPDWWKEMQRNVMLQPDEISKSIEKGSMMEDLLQSGGAIEGKMGEFVRFHLKGMGADDAFAKHFVELDHIYRDIYRKLRQGKDKNFTAKAGESAAQATERIFTDLRNNWKDALEGSPQYDYAKLLVFEPLRKKAKEAARRETFQAELGPLAQAGQSFLRKVPIFQIFVPFYRTPINITKETLTRTPLGFLNTLRKRGDLTQAEFTSELSRNLVGTLLGAGSLAYAMTGGVSGGGPIDPDERAMLESTGWQPYSARIGNNFISYQRLEPLASILGVGADAAEGMRNGDFQSAQSGMLRVLQSVGENITNKTFLSGLDALSSAISHPNQFMGSFMKKMQASLIPNSLGFIPVSGLARALDATYRQTEPFSMSTFYSKLPFLSSTLEPQYSPSGEERLRPGSAVERLISPFARTERGEGPARVGAEEVVRLAASPKAPRRYWVAPGGLRVDFLPEERKAMAQAMEAATEYIGQRLIKDPNYLALPDNEMDPKFTYGRKTKEQLLKDVYARHRDRVMQRIKPALNARGRKQLAERS